MIKGVIFDLGNTLIRFHNDWETVIQAGAEAMASWYYKKKHIKLDGPVLIEAFLQERLAAQKRADDSLREVTARESLQAALQRIEAPPATEPLVEAAIKIYFEPEEQAWQRYPDAVETLKQLKQQGYRLGLYSNATDDPLIQRLVNRNGLRPWLSPTFSSAGRGWRKPKPEAFEQIAERWGLAPEEIVVVGDTLNADVLGAQNAGMFSILATMDEAPSNERNRHIQPTATITHLAALPEVIAGLR